MLVTRVRILGAYRLKRGFFDSSLATVNDSDTIKFAIKYDASVAMFVRFRAPGRYPLAFLPQLLNAYSTAQLGTSPLNKYNFYFDSRSKQTMSLSYRGNPLVLGKFRCRNIFTMLIVAQQSLASKTT
jgi:hypothetical protein